MVEQLDSDTFCHAAQLLCRFEIVPTWHHVARWMVVADHDLVSVKIERGVDNFPRFKHHDGKRAFRQNATGQEQTGPKKGYGEPLDPIVRQKGLQPCGDRMLLADEPVSGSLRQARTAPKRLVRRCCA